MKDAFDFSGKVALVTGSSRGIGAAIITALGQQGARCAVNYVADSPGRNKVDADRVAQPLHDARVIQCDVGNPEQVSAMMNQVNKEFGGLDILVNNAGALLDRSIKKMTAEEWETVLRVNLTGAFNCLLQARELARQNITVNAIAPGFIDTEMSRSMPEEVAKQFLAQVPLGRYGKVADVVFPVLCLCSRYAEYITGQVIHVSGGFYMG